MESSVSLSPSNRSGALIGLTRRYTIAVMTAVVSALASPALANTITFETANRGVFTAPVTENGFTYSPLSGGLFINLFGNPGKDAEGNQTLGGGVLKIVSATGDDLILALST